MQLPADQIGKRKLEEVRGQLSLFGAFFVFFKSGMLLLVVFSN